MPGKESNLKNMVISLFLVTLGAAVSLGFVYEITKEPIAKARLERQLEAIRQVSPAFDNQPLAEAFKAGADSLECYPALEQGELKGLAVKTFSAEGYSGEIWLMAGFTPDGRVNDIRVLEHRETPGLGSKMADDKFRQQFAGKPFNAKTMQVKQDGGEIAAISGATITSRAFCQALEKAWMAFQSQEGRSKNTENR